MRIRPALALALAAAAVAVVPSTASARPSGFKRLLAGQIAGGGTFDVSGRRGRLQGVKGVCLALDAKFADGSKPGAGIGCAYGSLSAVGNVMPVATSSSSGGVMSSSLVGGIVTSRARTVKIRFADGTRVKLRTHRPPRGWRTLLHMRVRVYGASVLARTQSQTRYTTGYDRHGHKVAGHR